MLVELNMVPIGRTEHISDELAEALVIVDESGLPYQLTPTGTCIEGTWDEVIPVIRRCHERVLMLAGHVQTTISIEDEKGASEKMTQNIVSVEEKAGRLLKREPQT